MTDVALGAFVLFSHLIGQYVASQWRFQSGRRETT